MIKNFFIVAVRNLMRNQLYSVINILGLSIGIAASILILLWVNEETSYDKFIPKANRLYQLRVLSHFDNKIHNWQSVPLPTYEALKSKHSAIASTVVTDWGAERLIAVDDKRFMKKSYYVSEEFLDMFEFEMVAGDRTTALADPTSLVLTESMAKMLFGEEDPMGKTVKVNDATTLQVSGIMKDVPTYSSFQFDYLLSWKMRRATSPWVVENEKNWGNYSFQVFVELDDPARQADVTSTIKELLTENGETEFKVELTLYNMLRWRLYSDFENGEEKGGRIEYVRLFTAVALFILIIACINFMNLATARSEKRIREVGIRKSLGSTRLQLMGQFLGESMFIVLISYVLSMAIVYVALPYYNKLVGTPLTIDITSPTFWLFSGGFILIVGLISGSYPAFYLSSFEPIKTLKGVINVGNKAVTPRKVLVTIQFAFAILMMISTVVVYQQIEMARGRDLGYNQSRLITFDFTEAIRKNFKVMKQELLQTGAVESVTRSNSSITDINSNNFLEWPGKPEGDRVIFVTLVVDYDYASTMGIEVLQGRDFSEDFATDTSAIIINKAALEVMGLEEPVGTNIKLWGQNRRIVGVIDNVLMGSPYEPYNPAFAILQDWGGAVSVRLNSSRNLQESLASVREVFEKYNPAYPFEYKFVDQEFDKKFTTINLTQRLATIFSILTIFITGLGLFGLAAFTAEQRFREIGIRKVLGASVVSLVTLMSKETTKLVLLAFVVAAPIAWYLLSKYLDGFTLKVSIAWWIYPLAGLVALVFSVAIVAQQAHRVALVNPAKSLKSND